ncbi:hypothetical protein [Segatella bryantii]|uniref:hypothetical protein n=1 Tax=Segatella bryantii TaxID=77095 RepID=UPI00242E22B8|nr:hypothetical protein [Segatella bryantii]
MALIEETETLIPVSVRSNLAGTPLMPWSGESNVQFSSFRWNTSVSFWPNTFSCPDHSPFASPLSALVAIVVIQSINN